MTDLAIPIIDISPYLAGDPEGKQSVAKQIDEACREVGFFMVVGHAVPQSLIDSIMDISWKFFEQDKTIKRKWASEFGNFRRGYMPVGGNTLSYTLDSQEAPPDLLEAYTIGKFDLPDDAYHNSVRKSYFEKNIWPELPENFEEVLKRYYQAMEWVANKLMGAFALALDLEEDFFTDKIDKHITAMRLNHYPEPETDPLPGQLRAGAHTDYGSLTILLPTAAPGGLEVRLKDETWHPVNPIAGLSSAFVVNLGDLMERWTNDCWVSTLHRVVPPARDRTLGSRRLSIAFFHQPNYDAVIDCIETCKPSGEKAKYPPITSGEHLSTKTTKEQSAYAAKK